MLRDSTARVVGRILGIGGAAGNGTCTWYWYGMLLHNG
jgi:hypothetical protein